MTTRTIARAPECRDDQLVRQTRACSFELKAVDDAGTVEGYGSVFGVKDSYDDVVLPGAFATSLAEHRAAGTFPAMLWQHNADEPCGVWTEMSEDATGLRVKGKLVLESERGKAALALLKAGAIRGLSIGFMSKSWGYDKESGIRTLSQVDLWEVSLVTFPANGRALVDSVKGVIDQIGTPADAEKILREAGFSKASATAMCSRMMRMGEARREAADLTAKAVAAASRLLTQLTP